MRAGDFGVAVNGASLLPRTNEAFGQNILGATIPEVLKAFAPDSRLAGATWNKISDASPDPETFILVARPRPSAHQLLCDSHLVFHWYFMHTPTDILGRFIPDCDLRGPC